MMNDSPPKLVPSNVTLYCPIEHTLTIKKEKFEALFDELESKVRSRSKKVSVYPNIRFQLVCALRPLENGNGDDDEEEDEPNFDKNVVMFLEFEDMDKEYVHSKFSISVKSANYSLSFDQRDYIFFNEKPHKICNYDELFDRDRNFFVGNEVTFELKGMVTVNVSSTSRALNCRSGNLVKHLWDRDDRDFAILVEGRKVMIHKLIFVSRSPVFDAMLQSGMKESVENSVTIIDFSYDVVASAVAFFYDQNITSRLNLIHAFELIRFADKYYIKDLKTNVENYLATKITYSTVCQLVNGSIENNATGLKQICFDFLLVCLRQATPVEGFDLLDKEFAMELIKHALS